MQGTIIISNGFLWMKTIQIYATLQYWPKIFEYKIFFFFIWNCLQSKFIIDSLYEYSPICCTFVLHHVPWIILLPPISFIMICLESLRLIFKAVYQNSKFIIKVIGPSIFAVWFWIFLNIFITDYIYGIIKSLYILEL